MRRIWSDLTARPRPAAAALLPGLALALALPACDLGTAADGPPVSGEWLAVEYVAENAADPTETVRLIPDRGWFKFFVFSRGGYHEVNEWAGDGGGWSNKAGRWNVDGSTLSVTYQESNEVLEWTWRSLGGDRIELRLHDPLGYDFDGDGIAEPTQDTYELINAAGNPDDQLLGIWTAESFTFTTVADTTGSDTSTIDLVAEGGSFSITFVPTATFQYTETVPDGEGGTNTSQGSGDFAALDGFLWLMEGAEVDFARYTFDGDVLVVDIPDAAWDFDGDGTDDDATLEIRLTP
ncbi:MAG: hypothetical protein R6U63_00560 [Longimicrobiales bacterium]